MEVQVIGDSIHLSAYRSRIPQSVTNGKTTPAEYESDFYHLYGDTSPVVSCGPDIQSHYETLDAPPNSDFYANTEVCGRRKRFRPSLYQLYAKPEVRKSLKCTDCTIVILSLHVFCIWSKFVIWNSRQPLIAFTRMTLNLPCTKRQQLMAWKERAPRMRSKRSHCLNRHDSAGFMEWWSVPLKRVRNVPVTRSQRYKWSAVIKISWQALG